MLNILGTLEAGPNLVIVGLLLTTHVGRSYTLTDGSWLSGWPPLSTVVPTAYLYTNQLALAVNLTKLSRWGTFKYK